MIPDRLFTNFSEVFYAISGISIPLSKKYLVENRLSKYIGPGKEFTSFEHILKKLSSPETKDRIKLLLINSLTTNYSYFFRDIAHFRFLTHQLHVYKNDDHFPVRIWSAACSSGEELYSIAITVEMALPGFTPEQVQILGTDISADMIQKARTAVYSSENMVKKISPNLLSRYFQPTDGGEHICVSPAIRKKVRIERLNLLDSFSFSRKFDIVFLRNILIYFNREEKETIINRIAEFTSNGGYLILGHTENTLGLDIPFTAKGYSIYKRT
ncbi:MAG: protein-glutamate O-methyltransferase CheR [Spirochaetales bacterium]|nr:protein-glutamate O-methyltransferase CheR [Spirochaetales bacterium]